MSEADSNRLQAFAAECELGLWLQGEEANALAVNGALEPAYRLTDQQLELGFAPGDFTQVNPQMNQAMVNQALDWLAPASGEAVLDLFCGVGNFALALARAGAKVTGIEGSAEMVARATDNARKNDLDEVHFLAADLSKPLEVPPGSPQYTAALLDPPRDGAGQMVVDLAALAVERILYISCNRQRWRAMQAFWQARATPWFGRASWICSPRPPMSRPWHCSGGNRSAAGRGQEDGTGQSSTPDQSGRQRQYRRLDRTYRRAHAACRSADSA
ncbi:methyltransferase domain-containing protein [Halopseudomonas pachastrellae]|nr:methyltransferase domain-containing protein [Halopseudomonas pachastrellae]